MALFERQSMHTGDYSNNLMAGRDINIVVKGNPFLMNDLLALYKPIYKWHTSSERKAWIETTFGGDFSKSIFAKEYFDYLPNLKPVHDSSIGVADMMNTAYAVITGKLAWSAMGQSEGQSLLSYAYQMIVCINDNSVDIFGKSKKESSPTVDQKIEIKYPQLAKNKSRSNVGGEVFLKETNRQFSAHAIIPPKLLGFKPIEKESALVHQLLADKIKIHEVVLTKRGKLFIDFEVENLTSLPMEFMIPKGQVFENLEYKCQTQNLASTEEHVFILAPYARKSISIEGWCLNRFFAYPNGGKGRITIYETIDKNIGSQEEQWQRIAENVKIVQDVYPSLIPSAPFQPNLKETIVPQTIVLPPVDPLDNLGTIETSLPSQPTVAPTPEERSNLEYLQQKITKWFEVHGKRLAKLTTWIGILLLIWFIYSLCVIWYFQ